MSPTNPLWILLVLLLSGSVLLRKKTVQSVGCDRFASIDGLRGYLGFGVFLHHAAVWYFYCRSNEGWSTLPSNIYSQLGKVSVVLFFMITGFLFFSKILDKRREVDWVYLYVSRVMRLVPLYWVTVGVMLFIVAYNSNFEVRAPLSNIFISVVSWLLFWPSSVNGIWNPGLIMAGVSWTLPYEWLFYFSLPLFKILAGGRAPKAAALVSVLSIFLFWKSELNIYLCAPFLIGGLVAWLLTFWTPGPFWKSGFISLAVVACLVVAFTQYKYSYRPIPFALISIAFLLIALGNDVFGLLVKDFSRTLGELTYGIYLMHGVLLYCTFEYIVGREAAAKFTPLQHWSTVCVIGIFLLTFARISFIYIELPALSSAKLLSYLLRQKIRARS